MSDLPRPSTVSAVLQAWIYGGLFSADDLADAGHVSDSLFAKYRTGERDMPFAVAARISRYAQTRKERTELASLLCDGHHVVIPVGSSAPDGDVRDEVCEAVTHLGDLSRHFDADDLDAADRSADDLIRQARAAKTEIALRRGRTSA